VAKKINLHQLRSREFQLQPPNFGEILPELPKNLLKWAEDVRPIVDGMHRSFLIRPMWIPIYEDLHPFQMVIGGRQISKSTYATDVLAMEATANKGVQVCYVSYNDSSRSLFSNQRLRVGTFLQNPVLANFPRRGKSAGSMGEISLKNDSIIYCTTDNYGYRHVEGKSLKMCILDEAQYHDIEHMPKLMQTMMATKGHLKVLGIGGESGSEYERLWLKTNQCEWIYDDPYWREKLQFKPEGGLIIGEYLVDVLKGKWVPQAPQNTLFHGYHMPQTIFPDIPLTIIDAQLKYNVSPLYSIEYQQRNNPDSTYRSHCLGTFYHAKRRPVSTEMVVACMEKYRYLNYMTPEEIGELKEAFGDRINIAMGVDFGSSPKKSQTVITIIIEWKMDSMYYPNHPSRYQIAYIDRRPAENQTDQAERIARVFREAKCDCGVGDLGYGAIQVKIIQDGGANRISGVLFDGVGADKFIGCRSSGNELKPLQRHEEAVDEHGDEVGRLTVDPTTVIQNFIDLLEMKITHPMFPNTDEKSRLKFIIPYADEFEAETLIKELTSIVRIDMDQEGLEGVNIDKRQYAKKKFGHPDDTLMSICYAIVALNQNSNWTWINA
jgi:hypothetical protein